MGIYDRDYYREQPQGLSLRGPRTVVGILILLNVLVYLADLIFWPQSRWLSERLLCLSNHTLWQPYLWWQFLTYGFAHGEWPGHIVFNMLQLWFLGRAVEVHYGRAEFLRFYLASLIVGGVIWALGDWVWAAGSGAQAAQLRIALGASGAVCAVVLLFVLNFPHQTLVLFPIPIPVKAWVIGLALVGLNLLGAMRLAPEMQDAKTAYNVHLAGIGFALLYFYNRWHLGRLTRWLPSKDRLLAILRFRRRPSLGVFRPPENDDEKLSEQVDRILEKIQAQGADSLTRRERRILRQASRIFQQRRRD